ncbi:hypothetical protein Hanom_Chr00s104264g01805051 [Helianthus anomalus]
MKYLDYRHECVTYVLTKAQKPQFSSFLRNKRATIPPRGLMAINSTPYVGEVVTSIIRFSHKSRPCITPLWFKRLCTGG